MIVFLIIIFLLSTVTTSANAQQTQLKAPDSTSFIFEDNSPLHNDDTSFTNTENSPLHMVEVVDNDGDQSYDPSPIHVKVGEEIVWRNVDNDRHTVTSGFPGANMGAEFDSGIFYKNQEFAHMFDKVGEFPYFCFLHPSMIGTVIVE